MLEFSVADIEGYSNVTTVQTRARLRRLNLNAPRAAAAAPYALLGWRACGRSHCAGRSSSQQAVATYGREKILPIFSGTLFWWYRMYTRPSCPKSNISIFPV